MQKVEQLATDVSEETITMIRYFFTIVKTLLH